jgi:hypothetical protein
MCGEDILKYEEFFDINWLHTLNVQTMRMLKAEKEYKKLKHNNAK